MLEKIFLRCGIPLIVFFITLIVWVLSEKILTKKGISTRPFFDERFIFTLTGISFVILCGLISIIFI